MNKNPNLDFFKKSLLKNIKLSLVSSHIFTVLFSGIFLVFVLSKYELKICLKLRSNIGERGVISQEFLKFFVKKNEIL